jgi:hypothetical protein
MSDRKKYDSNLHEKVGYAESDKIQKIFHRTNLEVVQHPYGEYDIDIGLKLDGEIVALIEVENRLDSWVKGDFPHLSISLLERKFRYIKSRNDCCLFYLGFRKDMEDCYAFSSWSLLKYGQKAKINHRSSGIGSDLENEYRYRIPIEHAVWGVENSVSYMCGAVESYMNFK